MARSEDTGEARQAMARLWHSCLATQELLTIYLGVRLGLYEALAARPATPPELAERAGVAPRYVREWLEQQAVAGLIEVDDAERPADRRNYSLPPAQAEVLTASDRLVSMVSLAVLPLGGVAAALPTLIDAFRTGNGVADATYGDDWRLGHGGANRALFAHDLPRWLRQWLPDVHAQLSRAEASAADVACGAGWASVALACAYPELRVEGYDVDAAIVESARGHAAEAGVADRVTFHVCDVTAPGIPGGHDLVCLFDALHELPRPVDVLRSCRALRGSGGTVLVMDAKVAESFTAPGDEVERFQYATSVLHCLPVSLVGPAASGTGTVLRPRQVSRCAVDAGFAAVDEVPVADRFHRLYRLVG